jgi:hypothetical protein
VFWKNQKKKKKKKEEAAFHGPLARRERCRPHLFPDDCHEPLVGITKHLARRIVGVGRRAAELEEPRNVACGLGMPLLLQRDLDTVDAVPQRRNVPGALKRKPAGKFVIFVMVGVDLF